MTAEKTARPKRVYVKVNSDFDATGAVVEGRNRLEVDVTGTWFNRLRYDAAQPKEKRKTWTLGWPDPATTSPQPTGLFGPVRLTAFVP